MDDTIYGPLIRVDKEPTERELAKVTVNQTYGNREVCLSFEFIGKPSADKKHLSAIDMSFRVSVEEAVQLANSILEQIAKCKKEWEEWKKQKEANVTVEQ
jgi:hypothetical protein